MGNTPADAEAEREDIFLVHMADRWTFHSYRLSHDGERNIIHHRDGVYLLKGGKPIFLEMNLQQHNPRDFMWGPSSRRLIFWAPHEAGKTSKRVAIMDTNAVRAGTDDQQWQELYDPAQHWEDDEQMHLPFGIEWSPRGDAVYVAERLFPKPKPGEALSRGNVGSALIRIEVSGLKATKVTELLRIPMQMDFFMPPVSRFENGDGPSNKGYWIVFGAPDGLYLVNPRAKRAEPRRISSLPATGLYNIEWNPKANQLALYFKRPSAGSGGKIFRGVWLVHLDRIGNEEEMGPAFEQLYNRVDLHTLWYSPKGTYVTWSGQDEVAYRRPEDPPEKTVYIETHDPETNEFLEIKGCAWHHSERWLAYTAGTTLFVHDAKELVNYEIMRFSDEDKDFLAEPEWIGDRVIMTLFEDVTAEAAAKDDRPVFNHR